MKKYLICGGAGYIGAHLAKWLSDRGHRVIIMDNLSTGHRAALRWGELVEVDIRDRNALFEALGQRRFDGVVHMCARSLVGESMQLPYEYYENNVGGTLNVLEWMRHTGNDRFVFSSTAAIFGNPQAPLIDEQHPKAPINPYGRTKLMVEHLLEDAAKAYGLRSVSLRYFNACGADLGGEIGESHDPETHLIPNVLRSLLEPDRRLKIFGTDYATGDGTCVRDYVHVNDLASAHETRLGVSAGRPGSACIQSRQRKRIFREADRRDGGGRRGSPHSLRRGAKARGRPRRSRRFQRQSARGAGLGAAVRRRAHHYRIRVEMASASTLLMAPFAGAFPYTVCPI